MASAILKMTPNADGTCWDKLVMVVNGSDTIIPFIRFKDRYEAVNVYNQTMVAHKIGHTGDLDVEINGIIHRFTHDVWQAVGGTLDKWHDEYEEYVSKADMLDQTESQY